MHPVAEKLFTSECSGDQLRIRTSNLLPYWASQQMTTPSPYEFKPEVAEKLQYYVYRLIDPRNGETFYVGKGKGNRVFEHARGDTEEDSLSEKTARIRSVKIAGFELAHVIHRHGLDEETAFHVEAALIDAYPGISNIVDGHGNSDLGAMHASEIIRKYATPTADFTDKKVLLISVNRSALETSIYEATRHARRLSPGKAEQADFVLATVQGLIVEVFVAEKWLEATESNFPGLPPTEGRYGFVGHVASPDLRSMFLNKRVPDEYRKKCASNPINYTW